MAKKKNVFRIEEVKVVEVIQVTYARGAGTAEDPARFIYQYWDLEGNLLADVDECHDRGLPKFKSKQG